MFVFGPLCSTSMESIQLGQDQSQMFPQGVAVSPQFHLLSGPLVLFAVNHSDNKVEANRLLQCGAWFHQANTKFWRVSLFSWRGETLEYRGKTQHCTSKSFSRELKPSHPLSAEDTCWSNDWTSVYNREKKRLLEIKTHPFPSSHVWHLWLAAPKLQIYEVLVNN